VNTLENKAATSSCSNVLIAHWQHGSVQHNAVWRGHNGAPLPKRIQSADDTLTADAAFALASEGVVLVWTGDFQNARQLVQALARRIDGAYSQPKAPTRKHRKELQAQDKAASLSPKDKFNAYRLAQSQRARTLSKIMVVLEGDYTLALRRAPDWREACIQAYGKSLSNTPKTLVSLRELLGVVGAYEWRKNGVLVPQLMSGDGRIYPHYGVFAPVRSEYLSLITQAGLPSAGVFPGQKLLAFDIGTGTGVIAAMLAQRGVGRIVATDTNFNAIASAKDNAKRLAYDKHIEVVHANMFPPEKYGKAGLIVCNPPWLPARPNSVLEAAVYDPDSQMLRAFLSGLAAHLQPQGEGWLILSDLAEHLGLRTRDEILTWIAQAGLKVLGKLDRFASHPKSMDSSDALHFARAQEVTSLWRLGVA
jgi:2-polyprenyl-3-methyl-5-hydroxy-6-metoxy-1,4-benzoquinol methylase